MCRQSSARKSALQIWMPLEPTYCSTFGPRSRPGTRKNGDSVEGSGSAAVTEAMPSSTCFWTLSIGIFWNVSGCVWLCVPMVWPGGAQLAHAIRKGAGLLADQEEGGFGAIVGEDLQHLVAVLGQRAVVEGQHHLMV